MEIDLKKIKSKNVNKHFCKPRRSMIQCVMIDNTVIILKHHEKEKYYNNEKKIYLLLQDESFTPELKYFDDKNLILGLTDCGDALPIYSNKNKNFSLRNYDQELTEIIDKLENKYNLYHNDLRPKNICINEKNNIMLIDFDDTSSTSLEYKYIFRKKIHSFNAFYKKKDTI